MPSTRKNKIPSLPIILLGLFIAAIGVGCGGGGGGGTPAPPAPTSFTVGGTITGLSNTGLVLQNNNGDDLNISAANSTFTFATSLSTNSAYTVSIQTQAFGQNCNISNNSGTVTNANITDVAITCDTVTANDASGLYTGTGTATFAEVDSGNEVTLNNMKGIVGPDTRPATSGDIRFIFFNIDPAANTASNQNENVLIDGQITDITGTTITGTASIYQAGRIVANNVSLTGSTVTSRTNISLTMGSATAVPGALAGNFNGGTLNATFSTEFDRVASDARIDSPSNRNWGFGLMRDVYSFLPVSLSNALDFSETGDNTYTLGLWDTLTGVANVICGNTTLVSGTKNIPSNVINLYELSIEMQGITRCDELNGSARFTGFAAVVDVANPADTIWYATTNGTYSIYAVLNR